jgi:bacillithiol system protein YtxJ
MGIFNLFKSGDEPSDRLSKEVRWEPLVTEDQLKELIRKSGERTQIIFKNSTTCGISGMVKRNFESIYAGMEGKADLHLLHVQYNRDLSNTVSRNFQVRHESPQLLIIKDGRVVQHASHGGITDLDLKEYL